MDQNQTNSAAPAASPDEKWLNPRDLRALANRPRTNENDFLDYAPRVEAMAREILRMQSELDQWRAISPDLEAMHRELFGRVDPSEPRVTQSAARVLREQREELDKVDDLLNIGEVPRGMRLDRLRTVIADRNGRRRQLVEAHDALDKAGCPLPRFDVVNGARLPERIAAIVKQRDRAQRKVAEVGRPLTMQDLYCSGFGAGLPYREHTPAQLTVDQAHQALTRHAVPQSKGTGGPATLVERIEWLAKQPRPVQPHEITTDDLKGLPHVVIVESPSGIRVKSFEHDASPNPMEAAHTFAHRVFHPFARVTVAARVRTSRGPDFSGVTLVTDEVHKLREDNVRLSKEADEMRQAIGLMTTAKPSMEMRPHDPIGMAHEVVAEVEKLRIQLAACGVLAGCNTRDSLAKHRVMLHSDYDCSSVRQVIKAVEREIDLREQRDAARIQLDYARKAGANRALASIRSMRAGDLLSTDVGPLELTLPGTIQSLRKECDEAHKANRDLMAEREKFIPNLRAELAQAQAKLAAISQFVSPTTSPQTASTVKPANG